MAPFEDDGGGGKRRAARATVDKLLQAGLFRVAPRLNQQAGTTEIVSRLQKGYGEDQRFLRDLRPDAARPVHDAPQAPHE